MVYFTAIQLYHITCIWCEIYRIIPVYELVAYMLLVLGSNALL